MIASEPRDLSIVVVARGSATTGDNQNIPQEKLQKQLQVRPVTQKKVSFDVQK